MQVSDNRKHWRTRWEVLWPRPVGRHQRYEATDDEEENDIRESKARDEIQQHGEYGVA